MPVCILGSMMNGLLINCPLAANPVKTSMKIKSLYFTINNMGETKIKFYREPRTINDLSGFEFSEVTALKKELFLSS